MNPTAGVALYDPRRTDPEVFLKNFVARQELVAAMLAKLAQVPQSGMAEHQIFIGQRGMGKTSLLRRLALGIDRDPLLQEKLLPLNFREEQYNVRSLARLWRNCAEALAEWAEAHGQPELAERLDADLGLPHWRDDDEAAEAFLRETQNLGRRAVLFLDNLDLILDALKEQQWKLRNILQRPDGPVIYGAATRFLTSSSDQNQAFYEFFRPHVLEQLTANELFNCLRQLAQSRGKAGQPVLRILARDPRRLTTLQRLTGGNPRVLALLYQLLERGESATVYEDLEGLLDHLTPFYKARVEEYQSEQQRAIIDAVALHWDPVSANRLAEATDVAVTTISSQLTRLKRDGLIEEVETSGARAGYQLSERFFNIWYLMRHGTRRTTQKVKWLTEFLRNFYGPDELQMLRSRAGGNKEHGHPEYYLIALEAALRPSPMVEMAGAESAVQSDDQESIELFKEAVRLFMAGQPETALHHFDDIVRRHSGSTVPALLELATKALLNKGVTLGRLGRSEEAIAAYDDVIGRIGETAEPALLEQAAKALFNKGVALGRLGRGEEEISAYDDVISCFGEAAGPALQKTVASALVNKGAILGQLGRNEASIATFDDVVSRFGEAAEPALLEQAATALVNKGVALGQLGRSEEAIAAYDDVVNRFGDAAEPALLEQAAKALVNKGLTFSQLGRSEEAIAIFDGVVSRFGDAATPHLREKTAQALWSKANLLADITQDFAAAEASYLESLRMDPDSLFAKVNLAWLYLSFGHKEKAGDLRSQLGGLEPAGLMVLDAALAMADDNFGAATRLLGEAYTAGAAALAGNFAEDVWRLLRLIAARGYGEKLIDWFRDSGQRDRQAPLYAAFVAFVRGERFLNDFSPEVRGAAEPIYRWLSRKKPARETPNNK